MIPVNARYLLYVNDENYLFIYVGTFLGHSAIYYLLRKTAQNDSLQLPGSLSAVSISRNAKPWNFITLDWKNLKPGAFNYKFAIRESVASLRARYSLGKHQNCSSTSILRGLRESEKPSVCLTYRSIPT